MTQPNSTQLVLSPFTPADNPYRDIEFNVHADSFYVRARIGNGKALQGPYPTLDEAIKARDNFAKQYVVTHSRSRRPQKRDREAAYA